MAQEGTVAVSSTSAAVVRKTYFHIKTRPGSSKVAAQRVFDNLGFSSPLKLSVTLGLLLINDEHCGNLRQLVCDDGAGGDGSDMG